MYHDTHVGWNSGSEDSCTELVLPVCLYVGSKDQIQDIGLAEQAHGLLSHFYEVSLVLHSVC